MADHVKGLPDACIFVSNLSHTTTDNGLGNYFEYYGKVLKVTIRRDKPKAYGFVQFLEPSAAQASVSNVETHIVDGNRLRVEKAKVNSTLFFAKIAKSISNSDLRAVCEAYGPVESVSVIKAKGTNESKGCAFVKFVYREDGAEALSAMKTLYPHWVIEWTKNKDNPAPEVDKKAIFVGGLDPYRVTEQMVNEKFSEYGEIVSLSFINPLEKEMEKPDIENPTASAYCFIRFTSTEPAERAIENESGVEWHGRRLRVQHPDSPDTKRDKEVRRTRRTVNAFPPGTNVPQNLPFYYYPYLVPYPFPPGGLSPSLGTNIASGMMSSPIPNQMTPPQSPNNNNMPPINPLAIAPPPAHQKLERRPHDAQPSPPHKQIQQTPFPAYPAYPLPYNSIFAQPPTGNSPVAAAPFYPYPWPTYQHTQPSYPGQHAQGTYPNQIPFSSWESEVDS